MIEGGPIRTVIEAVFVYGASAIVRWYVLSRRDRQLVWRDRIFWNERDRMLKVAVPLRLRIAATTSEALYSAVTRPAPGGQIHHDATNQRWVAAVDAAGRSVAVVNDGSFAHSVLNDRLYLNVLRSPAYSSFNLDPDGEAAGRFLPRHDQGEHQVGFGLLADTAFDETAVREQAALCNQPPVWMVLHPGGAGDGAGGGTTAGSFAAVSPRSVQITALKKAAGADALIVRLLETAGRAAQADVSLMGRPLPPVSIGPYQLKTLKVSRPDGRLEVTEVNLIEEQR